MVKVANKNAISNPNISLTRDMVGTDYTVAYLQEEVDGTWSIRIADSNGRKLKGGIISDFNSPVTITRE